MIARWYIMTIVLRYDDDLLIECNIFEMNTDELMIIGCSSRKEEEKNKEEKNIAMISLKIKIEFRFSSNLGET